MKYDSFKAFVFFVRKLKTSKVGWLILSLFTMPMASAQIIPFAFLQNPVPILNWDFTRAVVLPSQLTFARSSTATYIDANGIMQTAAANEARFDHDIVTHLQLGLLMESRATNMISCSSDFTLNSCWWNDTTALTVTPNALTAPDNTMTATKLTSGADGSFIYPNSPTTTISTPYTFSIFLKGASAGTVTLSLQKSTTPFTIYTTAQVHVTTTWQRFYITGSKTSSQSMRAVIQLNTGDLTSVYAWGAQYELGSFPTSYIPTTTAAVTRAADTAAIDTTTWYKPTVGTISAEYVNLGTEIGANFRIFGVYSSGTFSQNDIDLSDSGTTVTSSITTSGTAVFNPGGTLNGVGVINTQVLTYAASSYALSINHATPVTGSTGTLPIGITYGSLGSQPDANIRNRYIRKIKYYDHTFPNIRGF